MAMPPNLRRLFTASPLLTIALLAVTVITLSTVLSPGALPLLPSSWNKDATYTYPPDLSDLHDPLKQPYVDDILDDIDMSEPLDLPPLDTRYKQYFPDLTLPSILLEKASLRPLAERLHEFLGRPGFDKDDALKANDKKCPRVLSDKLVNPDQYNGEIDYWNEISANDVAERRASIVNWLAKRASNGETIVANSRTGKGRGIVLTGGNQDTTLRLISVMRHLKRLNVKLPIEVFHYPGELGDEEQRNDIESLGGKIREIHGVSRDDTQWKNWQIKGLAVVQSSFREVLSLDSDNTPLRDPSHLFDAPLYKNHGGAVFWPDLSKDHPENAIWRLVGRTCSLRSWTFESGQFVVDKGGNDGLNLAALLIASDMQAERDFWFHMCGGDKDTFRWGFEILSLSYEESPRWMSALGVQNGFDGGRFCGHTVLQYDLVVPEGFEREPPLFIHSNLLKHLAGGGLGRGSLFTHVKRMSDDSSHLPTLNHAHSFVYYGNARGMCLDLDWHENANLLPESERERVSIETIPVDQLEGNVMDGFEDAFFDEGGRIGGW